MSATETHPQRHGQMWFEDGTLVLQAEQTTFKVHRSIMARQSDFFKDMLSLPRGTNAIIEEGTEAHPLFVPGTSAAAFAGLLSVIYEVLWTELKPSDKTLIDVLRAAHRLQFGAVLKAVVSVLDIRLSAHQKLPLGMACDIRAWQLRAFTQVVCGFSLLPYERHAALDDKMWVLVYKARESVRQRQVEHVCALPSGTVCQHKIFAFLYALALGLPSCYCFAGASGYLGRSGSPGCCSDGFSESEMDQMALPKEQEYQLIDDFWEKHVEADTYIGGAHDV